MVLFYMRTLDTSSIEARIKKLQQLRELAEDPEMVEIFLDLVGASKVRKSPEPAKTQAKNDAESKVAVTPRGELKEVVLKVLPSLPQPFNIRTVVDVVKGTGYWFQANDPFIAVGSVLKRLAKKGKVKRVPQEGDSRAVAYTTK
jgi:hypothetical protein